MFSIAYISAVVKIHVTGGIHPQKRITFDHLQLNARFSWFRSNFRRQTGDILKS